MCQASVILDGQEIMKDVILVEPGSEGVYLSQLFEDAVLVPAVIRKIDLLKHLVYLESKATQDQPRERNAQ
jgi:predicted RNA-binding protein